MYDCPAELKYTRSHEWVNLEADSDGVVTVGISDFAQEKLGEVVHVELPEAGEHFEAGDDICVVESVKAAADIYCPLAGNVVEVNAELEESSGLVNSANYNEGWLFKLKIDNTADYEELLDAQAYSAYLEQEQE